MCVCVGVFHVVRLTWTLLDTEGSIGVLRPGIVFQLEGGGVIDKRLGALGHACPTVIEVGAGLQNHIQTQSHTHKTHTVVYLGHFTQMKKRHFLTYPSWYCTMYNFTNLGMCRRESFLIKM